MKRHNMLAAVSKRLKGRRLVWAGLRGEDVEPLSDLPELSGSFAIMAPYRRRALAESLAYEELTGRRVDPEVWDIDEHHGDEATREFRRALLLALAGNSALLPYRPSTFLSAIVFARADRCWNLGMFGPHQSTFEHKPWVESSLRREGVPTIPWKYVADEEQLSALSLFDSGPLVLRRSRTSGGEGMYRIDDPSLIGDLWPSGNEGFVSVAPYFSDSLPVNVGATVWHDGVTVHHPSVQLIGIPGIVGRPFGYAGNDFGLMRDVDQAIVDQIEHSTLIIGDWLRRNGYLGGFGVDYLVHDGVALFTEINPRFQGSTYASCQLSIEQGEACLMLEHVAAWLRHSKPKSRTLRERVGETRDFANLVIHWDGSSPAPVDCTPLRDALAAHGEGRVDLLPPRGIECAPGAAVARWTTGRRVTATGYGLLPDLQGIGTSLIHRQESEARR